MQKPSQDVTTMTEQQAPPVVMKLSSPKNENTCCSIGEVENGTCTSSSPAPAPAPAESSDEPEILATVENKIGFFAKYLTVWVAIAMFIGTLIGSLFPSVPETIEKATVASIWLPGSVLVWIMVYPMMLKVRWSALKDVPKNPGGLVLTTLINWAVQPFVMYGLARLFFNVIYGGVFSDEKQSEYLAGAVILGGSPCTAMVFVWSGLVNGDASYTLVQVVLNDIILLLLYVPTAKLLLNISSIELPWDTVYLSVVLFVLVPFVLGTITQLVVLRRPNGEQLLKRIEDFFSPLSSLALVLLVVFIFLSQATVITNSPTDVLLVAVPLLLQTFSIFFMTYGLAYYFCLPYLVAGPASFIGSSNFFELAVALALTVYGPKSGAVLVAVVGVLVEVPIMLMEVAFVKKTKELYTTRVEDEHCSCKKEL